MELDSDPRYIDIFQEFNDAFKQNPTIMGSYERGKLASFYMFVLSTYMFNNVIQGQLYCNFL